MPRGRIEQDLKTRFEAKFEKLSENECWNWKAQVDKDGYGWFWYKTNNARAHRISLLVYKNINVPKELFVCHTCDNPSCVNPNHLFTGTHSDNMVDMFSKGRDSRSNGGKPTRSTIKIEDLPIIRKMIADGIKTKDIAKQFNVGYENIANIKRGDTFKKF